MLTKFAVAAVCVLGMVLPGHAAGPAKINWEFIVEAGSISGKGDIVSLREVSPQAMAFSDRPQRIARHISMKKLVSLWSGADFGSDPPNAGVTATVGGKLVNAIVELTHPRMVGGALQFDCKLLEGTLPAAGTDAVIFIDAFPTAVNSQITDS